MNIELKVRSLEKKPDVTRVQEFRKRCTREGIDLSPWEKRLVSVETMAQLYPDDMEIED